MTLPPMAVQRDGIITSSAAPLLPTCLPTYKHHLAQELYTYLDDDELVVMVMMIEPAAVPPPFFSRGHETPVNEYCLVFGSRLLYT